MKPARIMIIDDDPLNRLILEKTLSYMHSVFTFENAEDALVWLEKNKADLILLDIVMPGMGGYEALKQLKHNPQTHNIPVIVVSANNAYDDEAKGLELGAMDYITKPFSTSIVRARVRNQLMIKQKNELLEMLASIDGLTEIPNRRYLDEHLAREWRRSMREHLPLSVLMIDIDHFKLYNDHYGHPAGDECIKKIANLLVAHCQRGCDFVARYGGEEFTAVLPGSDLATAQALANKLRTVIEEQHILHEASPDGDKLTVSIGIATLDENTMWNEHELLELADKGLYKAKAEGRNRVGIAESI